MNDVPGSTFDPDKGLSSGVLLLLVLGLCEFLLLPGRVLWAIVSAPVRQKRMAEFILGRTRGSLPPHRSATPEDTSDHAP